MGVLPAGVANGMDVSSCEHRELLLGSSRWWCGLDNGHNGLGGDGASFLGFDPVIELIVDWCWGVGEAAVVADSATDGVDFGGGLAAHIVTHGGDVGGGGDSNVEGPLAGAGVREGDLLGVGDSGGFFGGGPKPAASPSGFGEEAIGDIEEGGEGVDAGVNGEFAPDEAIQVGGELGGEAGGGEEVGEGGELGGGRGGGGDVERAIASVADGAGGGDVGAVGGDALDGTVLADDGGEDVAVAEAVLQGDGEAGGGEELGGLGGGAFCLVPFDENESEIKTMGGEGMDSGGNGDFYGWASGVIGLD